MVNMPAVKQPLQTKCVKNHPCLCEGTDQQSIVVFRDRKTRLNVDHTSIMVALKIYVTGKYF